MPLLTALLLVLAGAAAGTAGAILGIGGGVLLVPLLVLGIGVPIKAAVATSLVCVIATSSAAASTNVDNGTANMRLGMTLELATALGAVAGGLAAGLAAPRVLQGLFALLMVPTAVLMWRGRQSATAPAADGSAEAPAEARLGGRYHDAAEDREVAYGVHNLPGGMGVSFVAGGVSGLLGIGGGVFKVPALHLLCGVPMKAAAATSNFMIGVTAAASAFLYYGRGEVDLALTATVVLGVLAGSFGGARVAGRLRSRSVQRVFAALLAVVAAQMLVRALS